ncbi:unnamed protein product, partial [Callosobruchus maculatus]
RQKFSLAER